MKKLFFLYGSILLLLSGITFAETVSFEVIVEPDTITVGEFVDLTIKAIDDKGNVDESYVSEAIIKVDGFDVMSDDVELPSLGYYQFKAANLGVVTFSKGLTIKKAGTYEILVNDLFSDVSNITGKTTIKVNEEGSGPTMGTLDVTSPSPDSELSDEKIPVIANTTLLNHPVILYIDDLKVDERLSDQNGDVTMYISGITPGKHTLLLNAVDLGGTVVASSEVIPFTYQPIDHGALFVGLEILPSNTVVEGDKVTLKVTTADVVDSVTVKIGDGDALPTSKTGKGIFTKELLMEAEGIYSVDLGLSVNGSESIHKDADTITVSKDVKKVVTLTYEPILQQDKVGLTWTYEGRVEYFKMMYGVDKSKMNLSLTSTIPSGTVLLSDPTKTRYAQVFPVDKDGDIVGDPSPIVTINPLRDPAPVCGNKLIELGEECDDGNSRGSDGCSAQCKIETPVCGNRKIELGEECDDGNIFDGDGCSSICKIQELQAPPAAPVQECETGGIVLQTKVVGGKYYLYWAPVNNAKNYLVYRQESRPGSISQMSLIGETNDPIFEYPFDPNAAVDQFAWYAVEAVCNDNSKKQLGDFEKVKVGPEQTLLIILLSVLLLRGFRKMNA